MKGSGFLHSPFDYAQGSVEMTRTINNSSKIEIYFISRISYPISHISYLNRLFAQCLTPSTMYDDKSSITVCQRRHAAAPTPPCHCEPVTDVTGVAIRSLFSVARCCMSACHACRRRDFLVPPRKYPKRRHRGGAEQCAPAHKPPLPYVPRLRTFDGANMHFLICPVRSM